MSAPRIVIAEDEVIQREQLARQLSEIWPEAQLAALCGDGPQALAALTEHTPHVLFLDIRMPGIDGLDVARAASGRAHVVFTTAYEEYAVRAFETGALDYLLKPIVPARLAAAVTRLRERLASYEPPHIDTLLAALRERLHAPPQANFMRWITATCGDTVQLLATDEVLFFQARDKYVRVVTAGEEAVVRMSLKELRTRLDPEKFWQIHRGTLVAVAAIDRVRRDELGKLWIDLHGRDDTLLVSSNYRHLFKGM